MTLNNDVHVICGLCITCHVHIENLNIPKVTEGE